MKWESHKGGKNSVLYCWCKTEKITEGQGLRDSQTIRAEQVRTDRRTYRRDNEMKRPENKTVEQVREMRHLRTEVDTKGKNITDQKYMGRQKWTWHDRSDHDEGRTPKTRRKQDNKEHVWNEKKTSSSWHVKKRTEQTSGYKLQDKTRHDMTWHNTPEDKLTG